jgi:hypothetical protein
LSVVSCGGSVDLVGLLFQALVAFVGCLILLLLASTLIVGFSSVSDLGTVSEKLSYFPDVFWVCFVGAAVLCTVSW